MTISTKYNKAYSIGKLTPYANNSRTHSDDQVAQVAASIQEFGFTNPVLIDEDGGIIAGHGRVLGAQLLGLKKVPTITLIGLSEAQKKAYVIADNQIALNAGWDEDMLRAEIEALKGLEFDTELLAFDDSFLDELLAEPPSDKDPDDCPEPPAIPTTRNGDIWTLGAQRLMCGDSTSIEAVEALMATVTCRFTSASPGWSASR